jgi:hypothetical protein
MIAVKNIDPEYREDFSDDLERYVQIAATEIIKSIDRRHEDHDGVDFVDLHKTVSEILMENIYIPLTMGEDNR